MPGLFRARCRLRPRRPEDHGGGRWRRLRRQRLQDLDHLCALRRPDVLPGAHRRTTGKKQEGISFLLIDMDAPRRRRCGRSSRSTANTTWSTRCSSTDVRVPRINLVGQKARAGPSPSTCSTHERTTIAGVAGCKRRCDLHRGGARRRSGGRPLIDDARDAAKLARAEIDLMALEYTNSSGAGGHRRGQGAGAGVLAAQDHGHGGAADAGRAGRRDRRRASLALA